MFSLIDLKKEFIKKNIYIKNTNDSLQFIEFYKWILILKDELKLEDINIEDINIFESFFNNTFYFIIYKDKKYVIKNKFKNELLSADYFIKNNYHLHLKKNSFLSVNDKRNYEKIFTKSEISKNWYLAYTLYKYIIEEKLNFLNFFPNLIGKTKNFLIFSLLQIDYSLTKKYLFDNLIDIKYQLQKFLNLQKNNKFYFIPYGFYLDNFSIFNKKLFFHDLDSITLSDSKIIPFLHESKKNKCIENIYYISFEDDNINEKYERFLLNSLNHLNEIKKINILRI